MNTPTLRPTRRRLLKAGLGLGALAASGVGVGALFRDDLLNPCRADLPPALVEHPVVTQAWEGIRAADLWDAHTHLAGTGDSDSGITLSPRMLSPLFPLDYLQRLAYLNAGCANQAPGSVDRSYVARLHNLMNGLRPGARSLLFAFDRSYDAYGRPQPEHTAFHVPDAYAQATAQAHPEQFEWVCSVHPYRHDAVPALEQAVAGGTRAVKWLPPAQGIDPSHPACAPYYAALVRLDLPLICHVGHEQAVRGANRPEFGNPLLLRAALAQGVRVVMAHCASDGDARDLERAGQPQVSAFSLFSRMMDDPSHQGRLFGDISALCLRNRDGDVLRTVLQRQDWHSRLLYGSDYPLPGVIPLISPLALSRAGLLAPHVVTPLEQIRSHNPLLFHFALMRHLRSDGGHFRAEVFATRPFFERKAA